MMDQDEKNRSRGQKFFYYITKILSSDAAKAAALKRADNPSLEYQSWEILNRFGIDLTHRQQRMIFGLIAAAMAKAKTEKEGSFGIGKAIAACYEDGSKNDQACAKLRRILACDTTDELCAILRPLLQLITSKNSRMINFGQLLDDLLQFQWDKMKVKASWAQDFFGQSINEGVADDDR